jgi:hypothetical protein
LRIAYRYATVIESAGKNMNYSAITTGTKLTLRGKKGHYELGEQVSSFTGKHIQSKTFAVANRADQLIAVDTKGTEAWSATLAVGTGRLQFLDILSAE